MRIELRWIGVALLALAAAGSVGAPPTRDPEPTPAIKKLLDAAGNSAPEKQAAEFRKVAVAARAQHDSDGEGRAVYGEANATINDEPKAALGILFRDRFGSLSRSATVLWKRRPVRVRATACSGCATPPAHLPRSSPPCKPSIGFKTPKAKRPFSIVWVRHKKPWDIRRRRFAPIERRWR